MIQLGDLKIVAHPLLPDMQPRMKLRSNCPVSDKFRIEFNQWLEEFFGFERCYIMISGHTIMASPANVAILKEQIVNKKGDKT